MKKEESIFVTEGYLLRDVLTLKFLTGGIDEKHNKKQCFVTWNRTAHENR